MNYNLSDTVKFKDNDKILDFKIEKKLGRNDLNNETTMRQLGKYLAGTYDGSLGDVKDAYIDGAVPMRLQRKPAMMYPNQIYDRENDELSIKDPMYTPSFDKNTGQPLQ